MADAIWLSTPSDQGDESLAAIVDDLHAVCVYDELALCTPTTAMVLAAWCEELQMFRQLFCDLTSSIEKLRGVVEVGKATAI